MEFTLLSELICRNNKLWHKHFGDENYIMDFGWSRQLKIRDWILTKSRKKNKERKKKEKDKNENAKLQSLKTCK